MNDFTVDENKPYSGLLSCKVDKESVGKRLKTARNDAGLSRDEVVLLDNVNISRTTLQQWEAGAREASIETIFILASIYKTNPLTLIAGKEANSDAIEDNEKSEYGYVPFYRTEASAGHGSFLDENREPTHHLAFRKRWLNVHNFKMKDLVGLIARGDSMEPTIKDGAAIIVDTTQTDPADGYIYVIRVADRLWVKRTQWLLDGSLRLNSDNDFYESMDISVADLEHGDIDVIGQVVHSAYDLVK